MTRDSRNEPWPPQAGDRNAIPRDLEPPDGLENRVVDDLLERGLIQRDDARRHRVGWQWMRSAVALAASVALLAVGMWIGRITSPVDPAAPGSPLTGAETDLYALLLLETEGYDAPQGAERLTRYGEYSQWVAVARQREQFVTGEDLEATRGWVLSPSQVEPEIQATPAPAGNAPLSGIFFIRARSPEQALELARTLPHLKHGGQVVVQKTIPTDAPPEV